MAQDERMKDERIPVIVGVGEITEKPSTPAEGREPLALMADALRQAEQDAGAQLVAQIDSIDIVNLVSWRYDDPAAQLCARLGIRPKRAVYGPVGGEGPIRYLHEAALRIQRGESVVGAVCGAESQSTVNKAQQAGVKLPWTPFAEDGVQSVRSASYQNPMAVALGVFQPITVYPFYDAASAAQWGQTPRQALAESGALWSRFADAAAANPNAWLKRRFAPEAITTPTPENRLIAWPYTKLMVANPMVNQSAALIVTSLAKAREAGIAEDRLIYFVGGAAAEEPRDYIARDQYAQSPAQNAVLGAILERVGGDAKVFDAIELYSCFPCVPKMARRTLGLGEDVQPTVTGGLTFFGAPLNDYMTHAACAMVRKLRGAATTALLYGQGGFVTKHHALVLSSSRPAEPLPDETSVQAAADRQRGAIPPFTDNVRGPATIESFTVIYDRDGSVKHGVTILRTEAGERSLARVPAQDKATIARLVDLDRSPIGLSGHVSRAADGMQEWAAR